ncbi:MAG: hypothetical protein HQK50_08850 [Oligoflexia bacterium]|nr:hypothetical protein [Oligoflexia bacterium]MBF0365667.1 hypothetical protein [Oligoflexia bacterium]
MKTFVIIVTLSLLFLSTLGKTFAAVVWYPLPEGAYTFGNQYPEAQRLLFAFDYGHALVYEKLLAHRGKINDPEKFEKELLANILKILKNPPQVKVDEEDIAPEYVFNFPLTVNVFDWSHMLHQFVLDVMSKPIDRDSEMVTQIQRINDQYNGNQALRLSDVCKTMLFMDGHYFSKSFRRTFPSFNLLIWSYHWFQIKLYEDLMEKDGKKRDLLVEQTVAAFWQLLSDLPDSADFDMMPETFKVAPKFSKQFPGIAASFDNNHMLHDIVSDILTSERVAAEKIKSEGIRFTRMAQAPNPFIAVRCPF